MDRNRIRRWTSRKETWSYRRSFVKLILILLFWSFPCFAWETPKTVELDFTTWKKWGAVLEAEPGKKNILRPKENTPNWGELFFDFEGDVSEPEETESQQKFKSKSISLVSSSYISDNSVSFFGKRSAYFSGKRNQIHLSVLGSMLFGTNPEPFSISIPIRTSEQGNSSVILDRTVFIKGKKYGFTLELSENKPILYVNNLLHKTEGRTLSFTVESTKKIKRKEWEVISIFFDTNRNRVVLYNNGLEEAEYTASGEDTLGFGFPPSDATSLILAKSFYGHIDGFHIHKGEPILKYHKYESVSYSNDTKLAKFEGSFVTSPVYETRYSHSRLTKLNLNFEKPIDTYVELYFRGSNKKFNETSNQETWQRIEPSFTKLPVTKFKFHQWKIWLRPNPIGTMVPKIISMSYTYSEQLPPIPPARFKLSPESTSENVCFHWNSNHELEVREGGGYQIHYGLEPSKMIGTIFVKMNSSGNYSKIDHQNSGDKESHILKHCISEESLISNLYIPEGKLEGSEFQNLADPIDLSRMEKRGHLFQSGLTYYFRISAYNKYLNEWDSKDQRSSLSEPVRFSFPKEISNR